MRRLFIILAIAIGTLTAVSGANATVLGFSGSGVLVRHADGYIIRGTIRAPDSEGVVATFQGTLIELTTGFNTCAHP